MISLLHGTIQSIESKSLVLMTPGGVGYELGITSSFATSKKVGETITLHTYLKVSDSALQLFGFESLEQRAFFMLVLSVSGVGPKSAMNILNLGSIADIQSAIARGDAAYLTGVQGMGKKTAERMIVELKNKVSVSDTSSAQHIDGQVMADVIDGLVAMGYTKEEARNTVQTLDSTESNTEQLLRKALKLLMK